MKRLMWVGALAGLAGAIGVSCTGADGPWAARQTGLQEPTVAAAKPKAPAPHETLAPATTPESAGPAATEAPDQAVADFIHRLQLKDPSAGETGPDRTATRPLASTPAPAPGGPSPGGKGSPSGPTAGGTPPASASTSGEKASVLPPPGQDAAGSASTSANLGLEVPEPGEEWGLGLASKRKPTHATEPPRIEAVSIVTEATGPEDPSEAKTLSTNEPLDATAVIEAFSIRKYVQMLEEALRSDPADVELQWLLSTVRLVLGEPEKATAVSEGLARESAELLRDTVQFFADVRQLLVDPSHPADETLAALEVLRAKLRERAELVIPVVTLCTRVRTFGVYDPMPPDQFVANQVNRTVVYTELKNFVSNKLADGQFETLLGGRLELLTEDGRLVWHHEEESIKEVSKQRREDFFLAQLVTFPGDLGPGKYVLKVMIQDRLGGKANEAHVEFNVAQRQVTNATR